MTAELLVPFFEEALGDNPDWPSHFGRKQNMNQGLGNQILQSGCVDDWLMGLIFSRFS